MNTREHRKKQIQDIEYIENILGEDLSQHEYFKTYAVNIQFKDVNFKQCVFDTSYFRKCKFISCNFTGSIFKNCNFQGAQFDNCNFSYTQWEKTIIEESFLNHCLPSEENLARDLVRSLRVNFSQIGNYSAVNTAIRIEIQYTGIHLYNAAFSRKSYYRAKHKGLDRLSIAYRYIVWKILDILWGNGESLMRVSRTAIIIIGIVALYLWQESNFIRFRDSVSTSFFGFWGIYTGTSLSSSMVAIFVISRLVLFGLFMAILVKRLSRR